MNKAPSTKEPVTEQPERIQGEKKRMPRWIRIPLRCILAVIVLIILIPVALYIPPVQTLVKNIACDQVGKSTGMKIEIGLFRLGFPLKLLLDDVKVIPAPGDTMVDASRLAADVKLLPLFRLDVDIEKLQLEKARLRILSADSSMDMLIKAGLLKVAPGSSVNIRSGHIDLRDAFLRDGDISLVMDVWKKKPQPEDTTTSNFLITANSLRIENMKFGMSMLPTIDTLSLQTSELTIRNPRIDLGKSDISVGELDLKKGNFTYLTPNAEYVAAHPAPVDTTSSNSAPMVIRGKKVSINDFSLLYAISGAKPLPGFDPSYIYITGLNVGVENFYNAATDISAPITLLKGRERSGLAITSGSGTFSMDSAGMALKELQVATPFSKISVTADIPNSLMALNPKAPVDVNADASIGLADINAFMPSLASYTRHLGGGPVKAKIRAGGELGNVDLPELKVSLPGILSLSANGKAKNILDMKRLSGEISFDGSLSRPSTVEAFTGPLGFDIPTLNIKGRARAEAQTYAATFDLATSQGDIVGEGSVGLSSEKYDADISIRNLNVASFVKDLGIGHLTAHVNAQGAGFNPQLSSAHTVISLDVDHVEYNRQNLRDITADIRLSDGVFEIRLDSPNPAFDAILSGHGSIAPGLYAFDVDADIRNANLEMLGLSKTPNGGTARIHASGKAAPEKWGYDVNLDLNDADWTLGETRYVLPALTGRLLADGTKTEIDLSSKLTDIAFRSPRGMKQLLDSITAATGGLDKQIADRNVDIEAIESKLPPFSLTANASGKGLLASLLGPSGMSVDTLYAVLQKDSLIKGHIAVDRLNTGTMAINSLDLKLNQRGNLLDYIFQMRNGAGQLEEFADVSISGYLANNRLSAYLSQHNLKGEQGYRLGLTAALADSTVMLHFTPLKATIAYLPWRFNLDNYISYTLTNKSIKADLQASSSESSILIRTQESATDVGDDLLVQIKNLKVQDFLKMGITAPPLTATVNSDIKAHYDGTSLHGDGNISLSGLSYDKVKIQDLDLALNASMQPNGESNVSGRLLAAGQPALTARALLTIDSVKGMSPTYLGVTFDGLPLNLANPFIGVQTAALSGKLRGQCDIDLDQKPGLHIDGNLRLDSAGVFLPVMGTTLALDNTPIPIRDNVITFKDFNILACNKNPLTISGEVDAAKLSDINFDMSAQADNFQLVGTSGRTKSDISGKLFLNLNATARGSLNVMDINATATILNSTNVTYTMNEVATELSSNSADGIVKFVNLQDTTQVSKADTIASPEIAMRISAGLTLQQGMQATVNINPNGSNKVEISPSGTLAFYQNYMGDMTLNGTLYTGPGMVRYNIPVLGTKSFNFEPESNVVWTGDIMNPRLAIKADDPVKANVASGGQASLVDFIVSLDIDGTLSAPKVLFDLSSVNDMSIQNELQGMTAEQRSTTAMNMLLTGQYSGSGAKNVSGNLVTSNLYSFMASQLNSWAANTIKGVDLSFGVNQYQTGAVEDSETQTSYSYQVSKTLFNNRFKIAIGGNYSTDASADENFEQNLISDISFEYTLKQSTNYNIIARLFRHTGFESILEGEITETGLGLAYRRKLSNLKSFFRFRRNKKTPAKAEEKDSVSAVQPEMEKDSVESK